MTGHRIQPNRLRAPRVFARGFTLVELLVVLVILGIAAGMVSLSIAPSERRRIAEELDRMAALFRLAHDEAQVSGQPITWRATTGGYRFLMSGEVRGESDPDDPLRPRSWGFEVRTVDANDIVFGREPLMNPIRVRIGTARRELVMKVDAFGELRTAL